MPELLCTRYPLHWLAHPLLQEHLAQRDARIAELEDNVASREDAIVQLNDTIRYVPLADGQVKPEECLGRWVGGGFCC